MPSESLFRRCALLAILGAVPAASVRAQQTIAPMSIVRIAVGSGKIAGRFAHIDSSTLTLETPDGQLVDYARAQILSMDRRRSHAGPTAKLFGVVGAGLGAAFGVLVAGACETSSCDGNAVAGALIGGAAGGIAGTLGGGVLGAMTSRWVPLSSDLHMSRTLDDPSTACSPRFELQVGSQERESGFGQGRHISAAATCGRRGVVGLELVEVAAHNLASTAGSAFVELPLGHGNFHPHFIGSAGAYRVKRSWSSPQNPGGTSEALGIGMGMKAWKALSPNFAMGAGARLHAVGADFNGMLESGISVSYRP